MEEIVERLQEKRNIEVAKEILESYGYEVTKKSTRRVNEEAPDSPSWYLISIDGATNAPGSNYYGGQRVARGREILKDAGISEEDVSVDPLGYDDITFVIQTNDKKYVDKIARKIAAHAEEPGEMIRDDWGMREGDVVSISGPYRDDTFEDNSEAEYWSR